MVFELEQEIKTLIYYTFSVIFKITLGSIGSLLGVLTLLGLAVNAIAINDLSQDQDSICSAVSKMFLLSCYISRELYNQPYYVFINIYFSVTMLF